jgi:cell division protein FtsZ
MSEGSRTTEIMRELGMSLGQPMIAVVGCGGAGNNIVNTIYWQCHGVHTVVVNTDAKNLDKVSAHKKIRIGDDSRSGGYLLPETCEGLTEEAAPSIRQAIEGYEIVFVVAGLGGSAGSGAAPVVARIAREEGAVVFGVPILPFSMEANRRATANIALERMQEAAHVVVPLDNDKLQGICGGMPLSAAFKVVDQSVLKIIEKVYEHSTSYVSDLIDEVSGGYISMEDVVAHEHELALEEIPAAVAHASLEPSLEFPFETTSQWDDMSQWHDMMFK